MSLVEHAKSEFEYNGWTDGSDSMQELICENLLELLETFANQHHSGFSAGYVLSLFDRLARFEPIGPLTGADSEWTHVADQNGPLYQNRRDGTVFKDDTGAYWIDGKIFRDQYGTTYTNRDSRVYIEFPWTKPKPEIVDVVDND